MIKPSLSSYLFALRFTARQRYILFFSFGLCIVLLWYIFLSIPLNKKIKKLQKKIDALAYAKNELQEKRDIYSITNNSCDTISSFLKLISDYKMSLESFEQQEESNNRLKVSISFSSSFDLIEPFFKKLTTLLPWIKIETIDFSASKKNASLITCLLIYSLYGDRCETIQ